MVCGPGSMLRGDARPAIPDGNTARLNPTGNARQRRPSHCNRSLMIGALFRSAHSSLSLASRCSILSYPGSLPPPPSPSLQYRAWGVSSAPMAEIHGAPGRMRRWNLLRSHSSDTAELGVRRVRIRWIAAKPHAAEANQANRWESGGAGRATPHSS